MLGFVPKWKVIQGLVQKTRPDIRHGAMREAAQEDVKEIEEGLEESLIEKMMDDNGKSSKLLWFNLYQKITRHMKGTHKPPDWISRAGSPSIFLLLSFFSGLTFPLDLPEGLSVVER